MLPVVVLSHVVNDGVHRECLLYDSDSKFFLFFRTVFLLFTFLFRTAFYFLLFFLSMSYSLCLLEPAIHRICHHLLVRLFSVCAVVPIFITFGGASKFQDTYHGFLYFLTFVFFSVDSLYCWCERNTGRHFIGFH